MPLNEKIKDFFHPKDLNKRDLDYHSRMVKMSIVPLIVYSLLFAYFFSIRAFPLLPVVGFSIFMYIIFIITIFFRKYVVAMLFGTVIGIFINYYLTFQFGWAYGFQFHIFPSVILAGSAFRGTSIAKYI